MCYRTAGKWNLVPVPAEGLFFNFVRPLSGVIRATWVRIGNSSDSCESAWRAIKIAVSIANYSSESCCESPVPLSLAPLVHMIFLEKRKPFVPVIFPHKTISGGPVLVYDFLLPALWFTIATILGQTPIHEFYMHFPSKRAWRGILMPRGKNCRETIFAAQLPHNYPHCGGNSERAKNRERRNRALVIVL